MVYSSAKITEWFLRCQGTNPPCSSNIETIVWEAQVSASFVQGLWRDTQKNDGFCVKKVPWKKICLNPRPQMLSNYSSLLPKMSCFILGLSRIFSVVTGWAALEPGLLSATRAESRKAVAWHVSATSWPEVVQTSCWTPQAGPQLREVSTQGKILGDGVGRSIQLECEGTVIFRRGVRIYVVHPDSLKLGEKKDFLNCSWDKELWMGETKVSGEDRFIGEWCRGRCELSWWVQCS